MDPCILSQINEKGMMTLDLYTIILCMIYTTEWYILRYYCKVLKYIFLKKGIEIRNHIIIEKEWEKSLW